MEIKTLVKLRRIGPVSYGVTIPTTLLAAAKLKEGDLLYIELKKVEKDAKKNTNM